VYFLYFYLQNFLNILRSYVSWEVTFQVKLVVQEITDDIYIYIYILISGPLTLLFALAKLQLCTYPDLFWVASSRYTKYRGYVWGLL